MTEPASIGTIDMEDTEQTATTTQTQATKAAAEEKRAEYHRPEDKPLPHSPTAARSLQTESAAAAIGQVPAEFQTSAEYFAMLARQKADTFAIGGEPSKAPIWICQKNDKVADVLKGMITRNILSVPVLLPSGSYFGFIDLMDVVRYVVHHFGPGPFKTEKAFFDLLAEEQKFLEKSVSDLMESPLTLRNPYHPIMSGYSSWSVVEALARERGLHRVPVINEKRQIVNLVTQSQVIRFLATNVEAIGGVGNKPIEQCKRLFHQVLHVTEDSTAIDAFNLMVQHEVQGVAICNAEGRLRGNLSLRDLKIVGHDMSLFWRLQQSVKNFVLKLRTEYSQRHNRPHRAVYVTPASTFAEVIQALAKHQVHRLYICDNHQNKHPIGVVTLQDVLLEICDS